MWNNRSSVWNRKVWKMFPKRKSTLFGVIAIVCVFSSATSAISVFPADHPRCVAGDLKCIPEVINHYIQLSANGMKELNIVPIDPLSVPKVDIIQSEQSPVSIKLYTRNVDFVGFSKLRIYQALGFTDDPDTSPFEIRGIIPQLSILGDYKITGSVLILPIVGDGRLNITMDNLEFSLKLEKKVEIRKGKRFLRVSRSFVDFNTTRTHMLLENLFNGDKLLGDTTNLFLNENWSDVINELKPALSDAMGIITGSVIRNVFDRFAYEDFWLPPSTEAEATTPTE